MLKIYTHEAPHHADEILGIAALCFVNGIDSINDIEIKCISDTENITLSDNEYMIDIGRKFDGVKCFDHHQLDSNISAFGLICDTYPKLKYISTTTLRRYVDNLDTTGLNKTLNTIGICGEWKQNCDFFPYINLVVSKANAGDFTSIDTLIHYFNWYSNQKEEKIMLLEKNIKFYEENHDIIEVNSFRIMHFPELNNETDTINGIKNVMKKHKCQFMSYKKNDNIILKRGSNIPITNSIKNSFGKELNRTIKYATDRIIIYR